MNGVTTVPEGVRIDLRVVPRASKDEIKTEPDGTFKVRLQAPPVEGKANKALLNFLAKQLHVPARDLQLISGETARRKRVLVRGVSERDVEQRLR